MSEDIKALSKSLVAANKLVKNPKKNARNDHFKASYATLDNVIEAYKVSYLENGISVLENPVTADGRIGVEITLLHESGQYITHDPFMLPPGKETAQGYGSSITYARRYALSAVLNISADEDDDGNSASGVNNKSNQSNYSNAGSSNKTASDDQKKKVHALAQELANLRKITHEKVMDTLKATLKFKSSADMTSSQASRSIKNLEEWINNAKQQG